MLLVALVVLVGFGLRSIQRNAVAMETASQEGISWSTLQLELELNRFRVELLHLIAGLESAASTTATLNNRFDILWSRVSLFQRGRVGERLMAYDQDSQVVARLFATMLAFETQIVTLQPNDLATMTAIENAFMPFINELRDLSRQVNLGEEVKASVVRKQIADGAQMTLIILATASGLLIIALFLVWRSANRNRIMAEHNLQLAEEADRASHAKSRFLTMMSHELRTPMNGVLGLLALAQQHGLSAPMARLLRQAERSAKQMIGLLTDILDFSAMQSSALDLDLSPFEVTALADDLRHRFDPAVNQNYKRLQIAIAPDMPAKLIGDRRRLGQTFSYLVSYLLETAGVGETLLRLEYTDGYLTAVIGFKYTGGETWQPDLLLVDGPRDERNFASGAIGPTIARGLAEQMSGTIRVDFRCEGDVAIVAAIPLAPYEQKVIKLRMVMQSSAMEAICKSALRDSQIVFVGAESDKTVDIFLIEPGRTDEAAFATEMRQTHPNAQLFAIGRAQNAELYDAVLSLPLDIPILRGTVKRRLAS